VSLHATPRRSVPALVPVLVVVLVSGCIPTIRLPALWVDGRLHELPPIMFRRKWAVGISLVNC
jgi:hypothetical protein